MPAAVTTFSCECEGVRKRNVWPVVLSTFDCYGVWHIFTAPVFKGFWSNHPHKGRDHLLWWVKGGCCFCACWKNHQAAFVGIGWARKRWKHWFTSGDGAMVTRWMDGFGWLLFGSMPRGKLHDYFRFNELLPGGSWRFVAQQIEADCRLVYRWIMLNDAEGILELKSLTLAVPVVCSWPLEKEYIFGILSSRSVIVKRICADASGMAPAAMRDAAARLDNQVQCCTYFSGCTQLTCASAYANVQ